MDILATPAFWLSLTALTFLEIVLGIDNLLFVSIAIGKLKGKQQDNARRFGVWGAMVLRIVMLAGIFWIIQLDERAAVLAAGRVGGDPGHARTSTPSMRSPPSR